ncbi:MAG: zinc metalloprotease HtpX [Coriobacteriia bacterium]
MSERPPRPSSAAESFEPLWERIDRNKRRFAVLITAYVVVTWACASFVVWLTALFFGLGWRPNTLAVAAVTVLAAVALYVVIALARSEIVVLRRLGAEVAKPGEYLESKRALHDMSLAAGFRMPPPLYVIDSPAVNAAVVGRSPETAAVAVTRGLAVRLTLAEERAVYAHLLARVNARDMLWATVSTVLMHPVWLWKKRYWDVVPFKEAPGAGGTQVVSWSRSRTGLVLADTDMVGDSCLVFPPYVVAVVIAHYMMVGQHRAHVRSAEFADAAALMMLKDPDAMRRALRKVVDEDNYVRGCEGQYAQFFYAWTGEGSSNDERDPEMVRLIRLEQTLGALASPEPGPDLSHLLPPRAPRLQA